MTRPLAGILTLLLVGAAAARAGENKPPAEPAPPKRDVTGAEATAPADGLSPKAPTPKSPNPGPAGTPSANARNTRKTPATAGVNGSGSAPAATSQPGPGTPADTGSTAPAPGRAAAAAQDEAILRDLDMLLILEMLSDYNIFEDVREAPEK